MNRRKHTHHLLGSFLPAMALLALVASRAVASFTIDQVSFHKSFTDAVGGITSEGGTADSGGVIMVFLRNTGATTESFQNTQITNANYFQIGNITLNGTALSSVTGFKYSRPWPFSIGPGQVSTIIIKGIGGTGSTIAEGQSVTVAVTSDQGSTSSFGPVTLTTPLLRVGSVIPGPDLGTGSTNLYIFLHNTDLVNPYTVSSVYVDTDVTSQSTFIGGQTVAAGGVKIIKVGYPDRSYLALGRPLAVRLLLSGGSSVGAYVRVTEPKFVLGNGTSGGQTTYTNSLCRELRGDFNHEVIYPGYLWYDVEFPGNPSWEGGAAYQARYSFKGMGQPQWPPNISNRIIPYSQSPNLDCYGLASEPSQTVVQDFLLSMACITNDTVHPTWINLAKWKVFQQYGFVSDFPCYDHYCQMAPLQYGSSSTPIGVSNAFYMADILKRNCEPLKCYNFPQGVSDQWSGRYPTTYGIQIQFWDAVMAGIKGYLWFGAESQFLRPTATAQYQAIKDVLKQASLIRNILLYSETSKVPVQKSGASDNILSGMLVGESAAVVITADNASTCTRSGTLTFTPYSGESITFTVPDWVNIQQVKEVTPSGFVSVPSYTQTGQQITINNLNYDTTTPCHVFLIGQNDTTPPLPPCELNSPQWIGTSNVLCWHENFDDFGVKGYKVYRDGAEIADVRTPLYYDNPGDSNATYTVKAYDEAGNVSAASNPYRQTKPSWTFSTPGDFCGWSEIYCIRQPAIVTGGALNYTVLTSQWYANPTSPNLNSPELRLDATKVNTMRIKFFNNTTGTMLTFWWNTTGLLSGGANYGNMEHHMSFAIPPNSQGTWVTMDCNLASWYVWSQTVAPVRLVSLNLPDTSAGGQAGESVQIQSIQFLATQTITFNNPGDQPYGATVSLGATASSGLPVSYTITGGPATLSGNLLSFTGTGSVTVRADQAGDSIFDPATSVSQTFNVTNAATTTTVSSSANPALPGALVTFTANVAAYPPITATPQGEVQFTVDGSNAGSPVALAAGSATLSTSALTWGQHAIAAAFAGVNFNPSSGSLSPLQIINSPPAASNATYSRPWSLGWRLPKATLLGNASDQDTGDSLNLVSVGGATNGTVAISGSFVTYVPGGANPNQSDQFTYTVQDTMSGEATATVTLNVDPPPATQAQEVTAVGGTVTIVYQGLLLGLHYTVERSSEGLGNWAVLAGYEDVTADTTGKLTVTDTPGSSSAFYRLKWLGH